MAPQGMEKMKTRKLTLLSIALLATLLIGAAAINVLWGAKELKLKVKWKPRNYIFENAPPDPWDAQIYFAPPRTFDDVNSSTIRLEGVYAPESDPYLAENMPRLVVPFDGSNVLAALLSKAGHLAPGEYRIWLEITGKLIDETPFRGKGGINLIIPEIPPP